MREIFNIEQALTGIAIIRPSKASVILKYIKPRDLTENQFKTILEAIQTILKDNSPLDCSRIAKVSKISVIDIIDIGDSITPSMIDSTEKYIDNWIDLRKKYFLEHMDLKKMAETMTADEIKNEVIKVMDYSRTKIEIYNVSSAIEKTVSYLKDGESYVFKTGFPKIDNTIKIRSTNLIVIAASPKTGKTTFALNIINKVSLLRKCLFFSFEMSVEEITKKLVGIRAERPINSVDDFNYNAPKLANLNVEIIESAGLTLPEIKEIVIEQDPGVIVIDQLDCIPIVNNNDRYDLRIGKNVVELKKMAMELKIPIFLIHQLNRDTMKQNSPQLYNLKDSSIIEQKADVVMMLWRDKTTDEYSESSVKDVVVKIGANRMGQELSVPFSFNVKSGVFEEAIQEKGIECPF